MLAAHSSSLLQGRCAVHGYCRIHTELEVGLLVVHQEEVLHIVQEGPTVCVQWLVPGSSTVGYSGPTERSSQVAEEDRLVGLKLEEVGVDVGHTLQAVDHSCPVADHKRAAELDWNAALEQRLLWSL